MIRGIIARLVAALGHNRDKAPVPLEPDDIDLYLREFDDPEHATVQEKWLSQYLVEVRNGNKILQLEMHLRAKISHMLNTAAQEQIPPRRSLDSTQVDELHRLESQLTSVSRVYLEHQQRLKELEAEKPPGRLVRDYFTRRHRRPSAQWEAEKEACRGRGGCCARDCGCCERWCAIKVDFGKVQYLHCRSDCDCCLRHRSSST